MTILVLMKSNNSLDQSFHLISEQIEFNNKIDFIVKKVILIAILLMCACKNKEENSQGENFSKNVNRVSANVVDDSAELQFFNNEPRPKKAKFHLFKTGSVKPKGWILDMMQDDLNKGVVGALAELYPGIKGDDLYNTARRGGMEDIPEMGDLVLTGEAWEKSIMWWNAETIGNWWDGYIRHAFLTDNKEAIKQSHNIINNLLASQDEDGYIGIYKPNLRYQHDGSNGELWAQTTAFRTMLAYYEFTNNDEVLNAVERAMTLTMNAYGKKGKNPFELKNAFGGVTHGLMLTDVCERLYQITNNIVYQEYATYLYEAFSTFSINRSFNDLRYPYLTEKDSMFEGHGVHTYEHIRSMVNAYYNTDYPELEKAYNNMLAKLELCILPSGAGHADEWLLKLKADPTKTAAEYCSMLELRNSYGSLIQKTGDIRFADAAEKLTYNAMLGSRNKDGTAITYSKHDNCYAIDGKHHEGNSSRDEPRYKYSPTHSEPAVCCVPNYGRNLTYFMEQMWMKKDDGIAAIIFGPSQLQTQIEGINISIEQITNYPISDEITFKFRMDDPIEFKFYVRKPDWSDGVEDESIFDTLDNGFYVLSKEWNDGDALTVKFKNEIKVNTANNNEAYVQKGPLVYAMEIPHREETIKSYGNDFRDYYCLPEGDSYKDLMLSEANFEFKSGFSSNSYYESEIYIKGDFFNTKTQQLENLRLIPIGKTTLRRTTFPKHSKKL